MSIKWRLSAVIMQWRPIRIFYYLDGPIYHASTIFYYLDGFHPETAGKCSIGKNTGGQRVTRA